MLPIVCTVFLCGLSLNGVVAKKSLNVLMYSPATGRSHLNFMGALADILVDAGHTVHIFMPVMVPGINTNGTRKAQKIIQKSPSSFESPLPRMQLFADPFSKDASLLSSEQMNIFLDCAIMFCEDFLTSKSLLEELRSVRYDIAITEHYDYCTVGLFHMLGIKSTVFVSAVSITDQQAYAFGLPTPLSYTPNLLASSVGAPRLSYYDKVSNLITYFISRFFMIPTLIQSQNELFRKYIDKDFPDLEELLRAVPVLLINSHPIIEIARPISANIFFIGGIAMPQASKIDPIFEAAIQSAHKGAVLFSLGSVTNTTLMPASLKKDILDAFARFPDYKFIMKISVAENDKQLFAAYDNVHTFAWIDQINLLNHPSVVAFITHGGQNSLMESMYAGKPMVCIPLFADQDYNTAVALNKGVAVYLDLKQINKDTLSRAIEKILTDARYMKAAKRLAEKLKCYPQNSKEIFLNLVEYVAKYPESDVRLEGAKIGFFKYFILDIFLPLFVIVVVLLVSLCVLMRIALRKLKKFLKKKVE